MNNENLYATPWDFGRALVDTLDLDPEYVVLHAAGWDRDTLCRWLVAYWCFSHCGTASRIAEAEGSRYWDVMTEAGGDPRYLRGTPRRHFRGARAVKGVASLRGMALGGNPVDLVEDWLSDGVDYRQVSGRMARVYGWGPWVWFKACDMMDRVGLASVTWGEDALFTMDPKPTAGALRVAAEYRPAPNKTGYNKSAILWAHREMTKQLADVTAPPLYDRQLGIPETETVFCKWEGYEKGTYWMGKDLAGLRRELSGTPRCRLTSELLAAGRKRNLWK